MEGRTELHIHTKMSVMDGVTDLKALLKKAELEKMKAVAITDHGVIHNFPSAYKEIKDNNYNVKLIFGMEGYMMDDTSKEAWQEELDSRKPYHIIFLVKNQQGLRNLYTLVSLSHMYYVQDEPMLFRVPLIPKSAIAAYREGLLIGTACEAGQLYRNVRKEKSDEELKKIASFYDYLEIQPITNNKFLVDFNMVDDTENLEANNKKIIEIGKQIGKKTVATCDTHYLRKEDSVARKVLLKARGVPKPEGEPGLYMRNSEEMYNDFLYLGEDLAKEVVFNAPSEIADMIEDIEIPFPDIQEKKGYNLNNYYTIPMGKITKVGLENAKIFTENYLDEAPVSVSEAEKVRIIKEVAGVKTGIECDEKRNIKVLKGEIPEKQSPLQYENNDKAEGKLISHFDSESWIALGEKNDK